MMKNKLTKIKKTISEKVIQRQIMNYLQIIYANKKNIYVFRAGAGAIKTWEGYYFKSGKPGLPDIICCIDGKFIGLEIKTKKGKQSLMQKYAENQIKRAGGEYHIIRSLKDVKVILPC